MKKKYLNYRDIIQDEFDRRKNKNRSYSLRAFARDLEVLPSQLSEVLNDRQGLSEHRAKKFAERMKLDEDLAELFVNLVVAKHGRSSTSRRLAKKNIRKKSQGPSVVLTEAQFSQISQWYHFAILEMLHHEAADAATLSKYFGLSQETVETAIEKFQSFGLLSLTNGKYRRNSFYVATTHDVPSNSIKNYHRQITQKSLAAIDLFPVNDRDHSSANVLLSAEDMIEAKKMISSFCDSFIQRFKGQEGQPHVFALNLHLFPLRAPEGKSNVS